MAAFIMNKIERIKQLVDFKVEGKYQPMDHQWQSAVFMAEHRRCFNLSTMRTGKTGSTHADTGSAVHAPCCMV